MIVVRAEPWLVVHRLVVLVVEEQIVASTVALAHHR